MNEGGKMLLCVIISGFIALGAINLGDRRKKRLNLAQAILFLNWALISASVLAVGFMYPTA